MTLRTHPELAVIFKEAESRHLDPDELSRYAEVSNQRDRATAAQEVREHEGAVVKGVVTSVFKRYPYEEHHDNAMAKCIRDVRYVSAYSTMAMLMDDVQWLDDKLLIWLKTILQSFEFPEAATRKRALFAARTQDPVLERLEGKRQSIYETYTRLRDDYESRLTPNSFALMRPALQRVVDTLTEDS